MRHILWSILMLTAAVAPVSAEVINIDNRELARLIDEGVPVVDVRTPPEWESTGVIAGSHLMMFFDERGGYDARSWLTELGTVTDPSRPVILICRTGNRTTTISSFLDRQVGFATVYNVEHGITAWIEDDRPVSDVN